MIDNNKNDGEKTEGSGRGFTKNQFQKIIDLELEKGNGLFAMMADGLTRIMQ